ncbi:penicillin-binding protein [Viscerimonas tarda]
MPEESTNIKNKKGARAINRYGIIAVALSCVFVAVVVYIFQIRFVEGEMWRAIGERERTIKDRVILPNRGNIYAADGRLLATSEPLYGVYVDFLSEGIKHDTLMKYVGDLSAALARKFPDKTAAQYKKIFMDGWALSRKEFAEIEKAKSEKSGKKVKTKSRYIRIIKRDVNYPELKEIRTFPYFNKRSNQNGMIAEEKTVRKKPFGRLAGRTIGSIYKEISMGGTSGIELKYDSILRGVPGTKSRQKIQRKWIDIVDVPAQDGLDIKTTIDVDIQDIVEKALYAKLAETEAESGCAVIMEVETGEIKAISNLDRISNGAYAEGNPNVFSYMSEPGSTFKTASIMVALEDGVVTPQDSFYVGVGAYAYEYNTKGGKPRSRTIFDHYWRQKKDRGYLTVAEGMYVSSNIVVAKTILKGYRNNPGKYVQRLYDLGITKKLDWDVPLKGKEGTAVIRHPKDKANPWSATTLPWMSFGYETQIPPIYTLMFYNGIANNGLMIKPFITKSFLRDGKAVEEFETEVVNPSLCSDRTLKQIQDILVGVVNEGTAKVVDTDLFQIAGKTGTALIASNGGYSGYFVSFCGYFPADKPKYTCFVGVRRPKGNPSGGGMPGMVFRNIAEEVYAHNMRLSPSKCSIDSALTKLPHVKNGQYSKLETVLKELNVDFRLANTESEWVRTSTGDKSIELNKNTIAKDIVPDVTGMGARNALYLLEKSGLKVGLSGTGKVINQSIPAGNYLVKGSYIEVQLN